MTEIYLVFAKILVNFKNTQIVCIVRFFVTYYVPKKKPKTERKATKVK